MQPTPEAPGIRTLQGQSTPVLASTLPVVEGLPLLLFSESHLKLLSNSVMNPLPSQEAKTCTCSKRSNENVLLPWFNSSAPETSDYLKTCSMGNHGVWGKQLLCFKYNCEVCEMTSVKGRQTFSRKLAAGDLSRSEIPELKYPLWGCTQDKKCGWAEFQEGY